MRGKRLLLIMAVVVAVLVTSLQYNKILLRRFYPMPYREVIREKALANDIDPFLIAAIIKVESNFRPDALSPKGARGLMQLMPDTAAWVSEQLALEFFDTKDLFEPAVNIQIGTWYLAHLLREFDNNLNVALASYNGGRGNVRSWLTRGIWTGNEEDIDSIPFPETRQYLQRVLFRYRQYRWIYDGNWP